MSASESTLIVKNIPKLISDISSILPSAAKEVKPFGRRRVLLTYENEQAAQTVLEQLQQLEVKPGKQLNVTFFRKNVKPVANTNIAKTTTSNKATQTKLHPSNETALPQISMYVSQLFACDAKLNFVQPPPPYLKYAYPRITPDILDAISIALMSNTRFYTQVLHLMNRMNLEPPFGAKSAGICLRKLWPRDVSTQTMEEAVAVSEISEVLPEATKVVDEKSESELESSDEDDAKSNNPRTPIQMQLKRKAAEELEAQLKKKARQLLQTTLRKQKRVESIASASKNLPQNAFEQSESVSNKSRIAVKIQHQQSMRPLEPLVLPSDLSATRLSLEQLQALPVYKNYQIGAPSNKLYIKNLAKDVSEEDLKQLYARFVPVDNMEIKVMQQGRMKGQAFVTFHGLSEVDAAVMMAKALAETNGFVLRQKPMVVCYGKK
ncbi:RNA-binding region-containing protein 3 isoform X1 [Bactrocera dorsalis]|uniref:RNA-binding region-containing protein 3 isoform X1 n=1 Tax=Bactrocera dorsalis TaxID=27457 RepID=A0A6J0RMM7_BACDO|nr:RNA-binding region-containing protein 3 isoform X1 [Bactrocera dorsalis]